MSFLIENFDSDIHGIIESYTEYILTLNDSAGNVKNQSRSFFPSIESAQIFLKAVLEVQSGTTSNMLFR